MSIIKVMDDNLSNKIAAGEVVESIHSVVKELVENSIDAQADSIKINLEEAGFKSIKVIDNGNGMDAEDAKLSFLRHATSKIKELDDLFTISTLGFRGEALPSIASISKVLMLTFDGKDSIALSLEGGKLINETKGANRRGTEIEVKHLFYNTPARLKHMKSIHRELADVVNYVNKMALAYPNIKWELTNDGKNLLKTDGRGKLLKTVSDIYGMEVTKKMLDLNAFNDDYQIEGLISLPEVYRSTRNHITLLVNGRNVRSNEINKAILEAYHTYLPDGKIPVVVLNIVVDPTLVDVNIHPAKLEVKFSKIEELKELIFDSVRKRLNQELLIPEVSINNETNQENIASNYQMSMNFINDQVSENNDPVKLPFMEVKGFVKGTYIICEDDSNMYLIDQHAANERINYEKYLKALTEKNNNIVNPLMPFQIRLTKGEYLILEKHFDLLEKLNINYQEFGDNTILINSYPWWLPYGLEEEAINKIVEIIVDKETSFDIAKFNNKVAALVSCKMSIKANQNISIEEAEKLINELRLTENPYTCPHGRPVIINFSNYELEKLFKRAMV